MYQITDQDKQFMRRAIELSAQSLEVDSIRPFGAVLVQDGVIIAEAWDSVVEMSDPTAHAEIVAMRRAAQKLQSPTLSCCRLYTSCEPCPMCLGAIYWSDLESVFYTNTQIDMKSLQLDDEHIYREMNRSYVDRSIAFQQIPDPWGLEVVAQLERLKSDTSR